MLRTLGPSLWCIETPFRFGGLEIGARLTVARLRDGTLWLHAPFEIGAEDEAALRALGEVRHLVVPNTFHFKEAPQFARRFPAATLWAVPEVVPKLGDAPHQLLREMPLAWRNDFDGLLFDAALLLREWAFCHRASRTLLLTDLCVNLPRPHTARGRLAARLLRVGGRFGPSRFEQLLIVARLRCRRARAQIETMLRWDWNRVTVAHGAVLQRGGKQALRRAFAFLR